MKTLKIICLVLLSIFVVSSVGFAEEKSEQKKFDYYAEYTGKIMRSDRNFILVNIIDTDAYVGIRILDKQGFIVDGDLIQGQLIRSAKSIVIVDITQESKFVGKVVFGENSLEEVTQWWELRYELKL